LSKTHSHITLAEGSSFNQAASSHVYLCVLSENSAEGILLNPEKGVIDAYFKSPKAVENKDELTALLPSQNSIYHIGISHARFCLSPTVLFQAENAQKHLQLHFKNPISSVRHQALEDLDTHILFEPFGDFDNQQHIYAALIQAQRLGTKELNKHQVYLHFVGEQMSISIFKHKALVYFNAFDVQTEEDVLYFLLYTLDQLNISTSGCHLSHSGSPTFELSQSELLRSFLPPFHPIHLPGSISINPQLQVSKEELFALISLYICG